MLSTVWEHKNLLDVTSLSTQDIDRIINLATYFFENARNGKKQYSFLQGQTIFLYFAENSTRTRLSFEVASQRLGAMTHYLQNEGSSIQKGESIVDTFHTLIAMKPEAIVMRSPHSGILEYLAKQSSVPLLNAGDGWHAHPSQALLDLFTLHRVWSGRYEGKVVTIVGDVKHSRVARSTIQILQKVGIRVRVCSPATLSFVAGTFDYLEQYTDVEKAIQGADAIIGLRLQKERQAHGLIPQEYTRRYGIKPEHVALAHSGVTLLHPGPVNANIDMHATCIRANPYSKIDEQVEAGVAVRMALLYLFCTLGTSIIEHMINK